jgi:HlyD family secretion protein
MDRPVAKGSVWSRKRARWIAAAVALLAVAWIAYPSIRRWAQSETSIEASRVRLATVTRGDLVRDVSVQGNVVAAFRPTLVSPARGTVRVDVKPGQVVAAGEALARVESPEVASRLGQERSTLLSLRADLERQRILSKQAESQSRQDIGLLEVEVEAARRAMKRAELTREQGLINAVEFERAQDAVKVSEMRLELARQEATYLSETMAFEVEDRASRVERQRLVVEDLERQVNDLAIRSPVAGLVSRVEVNDRDAVDAGQALATVVDLSAFEIEIAVPENYADELAPGTEAVITSDGREFVGALKSISPVVEGSRVKGVVAFTAEAPRGLKQNQRVSARLILETRNGVLKVARGPFLEAGGGRSAYAIEDGTAVARPIEVGALSVSEIEILGGLTAGDRIIISDTARFRGAKRVLLRD